MGKNRDNRHRLFAESLSQSIERGQISRVELLVVRESRERRDKIVPIFSQEKQEKRNFGLIFFTF